MNELLEFATSPWSSIGLVLLLFGVGPSALLRIAVRAYPCRHPRRAELLAEFEQVPFRRRPLWVAALVPVCLDEGTGARRDRRLEDRRARAARRARVFNAIYRVDEGRLEPTDVTWGFDGDRPVRNQYVVVVEGEGEIEVMRTFSGRRRWWPR